MSRRALAFKDLCPKDSIEEGKVCGGGGGGWSGDLEGLSDMGKP